MTSIDIKLKESEEKFKALFKVSPVPTYAWQKRVDSFELIDYNTAANIITQGNVQNFIGIKATDMYKERPDILEDFKSCYTNKTDSIREMKYTFNNSKEEKILLVKYAFLPPDLVLVHTEDITMRKNSENKLKESEEKFSKAFRSSPNLMAITRMKDGYIVDVNDAFTKILGYKREELIGHTTLELDLWVDPQERDEFVKRLRDEKKVDSFDVKVYTKSGKILNTLYSGDVIYLNNEPHLITIASDISERRKTEQELKESEQKFKDSYDRANFYKDLFSHDMTNILQVINSSAELIFFQLGDSEKSKNIANIASIIKKQIERGTKLISNVRTLSELEEEENITKRVEIIKFINNAITFVKKAYERRNVKISFEDVSKKHYTNANELLQDVFENVLINGIKYNENSNIEISIKISKQEVDAKNYIKIEFIDNGMGVSDERKKVIFLSGNRELKGSKGMGLGLSLVSKILNIFNGEVWVENNIKGDYTKGSNFVILLPEVK